MAPIPREHGRFVLVIARGSAARSVTACRSIAGARAVATGGDALIAGGTTGQARFDIDIESVRDRARLVDTARYR